MLLNVILAGISLFSLAILISVGYEWFTWIVLSWRGYETCAIVKNDPLAKKPGRVIYRKP